MKTLIVLSLLALCGCLETRSKAAIANSLANTYPSQDSNYMSPRLQMPPPPKMVTCRQIGSFTHCY